MTNSILYFLLTITLTLTNHQTTADQKAKNKAKKEFEKIYKRNGLERYSSSYAQCFDRFRSSFQWPLGSIMEQTCITSTVFGPALSQCQNPGEYTFSRAMNLASSLDDPVYAVYDGVVVKKGFYFKKDEENGLETIIIRHEVPEEYHKLCKYDKQTFKHFFTIYGHIQPSSEGGQHITLGQNITSGEKIGSVGISKCPKCGDGTKLNLLFQLRLGLSYCVDLNGECGQHGSPVNPYLARPLPASSPTTTNPRRSLPTLVRAHNDRNDGGDLSLTLTTSCFETYIDMIVVECDVKEQFLFHILNTDKREGFDAIPHLYRLNRKLPYIRPELYPFAPRSEERWKTNVVIPRTWCPLLETDDCIRVSVESPFFSVSKLFCGSSALHVERGPRLV